jgi:hypothetical protein
VKRSGMGILKRLRKSREVKRDPWGREIPSNFTIQFTQGVLAESLWEYGEDDLAARAAELSASDLEAVQRFAVWHHVNDPEPESGPQLLSGRVDARARGNRLL